MQKYIAAYFTDEENLLEAVKALKAEGVTINDVLSPFPIHGLDKLLGLKPSRLHIVGFIAGAIGAICAFTFQAWVFNIDYPLNIGGKPFFAVLDFIPIGFEITVLFAAFAMLFAFLIKSKLFPGAGNIIHNERITDDLFCLIVVYKSENSYKAYDLINKYKPLKIDYK